MNGEELRTWHDAIEASLDGQRFNRVRVIAETKSTQDAAFSASSEPGLVVVTGCQSQGRGRLGRAWDGGHFGVAVSCLVEVDAGAENAWRLPGAAGLAAAAACDDALGLTCRLRWPNDVIEPNGLRKIAGVLVETRGTLACIGIGINVLMREWPTELKGSAVSLAELGSRSTRLEIICILVQHLAERLNAPNHELLSEWKRRELLIGRQATFREGSRRLVGVVTEIDPDGSIVLQSDQGEHIAISAATATLIQFS